MSSTVTRSSDRSVRIASHSRAGLLVKAVVTVGLMAVAFIHFRDISEKLDETQYIGVGYVGLVVGCLLSIALIWFRNYRAGLVLAFGLCVATFAGYVLSRTTGLPSASYDVGNWSEIKGTISLIAEGAVALIAAVALTRAPQLAE